MEAAPLPNQAAAEVVALQVLTETAKLAEMEAVLQVLSEAAVVVDLLTTVVLVQTHHLELAALAAMAVVGQVQERLVVGLLQREQAAAVVAAQVLPQGQAATVLRTLSGRRLPTQRLQVLRAAAAAAL
jgi:hypothetical protein